MDFLLAQFIKELSGIATIKSLFLSYFNLWQRLTNVSLLQKL